MIEWIIFILVCFVYIHLVQQYKHSDEMDVYEYDYVDNYSLQDTCNLLQPFVFSTIHLFPPVPKLDENIECMMFLYDNPEKDPIQLPNAILRDFIHTSKKQIYFSEYNRDMIHESTLLKNTVNTIESYIIPSYTLYKTYDITMGSYMAHTALKYHTNTRKFLYVTGSGSIRVKLTPWKKYSNMLHEVCDYDRGEYRSKLNVWNTNTIEGVSFIEISVLTNHILYIPPYWGYSIQYTDPDTYILDFTYSTVFNTIAFIGEFFKRYLQQENIYKKLYKTFQHDVVDVSTSITSHNPQCVQDTSQYCPESDEGDATMGKEVLSEQVETKLSVLNE